MGSISKASFQNAEYLANNSLGGMIPMHQDLADSTFQYYGFMSPGSPNWLIQRFHIQGSTVIYEYARGNDYVTYAANWNSSGSYVGNLTFVTYNFLGV